MFSLQVLGHRTPGSCVHTHMCPTCVCGYTYVSDQKLTLGFISSGAFYFFFLAKSLTRSWGSKFLGLAEWPVRIQAVPCPSFPSTRTIRACHHARWTWNSLSMCNNKINRLGCWANEPQISACGPPHPHLIPSSTWIVWLFKWVLRIKHMPSSLCGKHFTDWPIAQSLPPAPFWSSKLA